MTEPKPKRSKHNGSIPPFEDIEDALRHLERNGKLVDTLKIGWKAPLDMRQCIVAMAKPTPPNSQQKAHREQRRMFDYDWKIIQQVGSDYHPGIELLLKSNKSMKLPCRNGVIVDVPITDIDEKRGMYRIRGTRGGKSTGIGCPECHGDEVYDFEFLHCPDYDMPVQLTLMNWIECICDDNMVGPPGGYKSYVSIPM